MCFGRYKLTTVRVKTDTVCASKGLMTRYFHVVKIPAEAELCSKGITLSGEIIQLLYLV